MSASLRGNAVWQFLVTASATGAEVVILLTFATYLSPRDFGALAVALSAAKIAFLLVEPRIHEFLTPKLARYLDRSSRAAWNWTAWSRRTELRLNTLALVACGLGAFALAYLNVWGDPILFLSCALYCFLNTLLKFSSLAILRCLGQVQVAAWTAMAGAAGKLAILAICMHINASVAASMLAIAVPAGAAGLSQAWFALRRLRARLGHHRVVPARPLRRSNWRRQRAVLVSNYATGLIEIAHRELDVQIIAWAAGAIEGGRYRLAKTLAAFVLEALSPVVLVLLPELARRVAPSRRHDLIAFTRRITLALGGMGVSTALLVAVLSSVYLGWIAPTQEQARVPVMILIAGYAALSPVMWAQSFLVATGRPEAYTRASLIGAIVATACAFVLASRIGAVGSALSHLVGLVTTSAIAWFAAQALLRDHAASGQRDRL